MCRPVPNCMSSASSPPHARTSTWSSFLTPSLETRASVLSTHFDRSMSPGGTRSSLMKMAGWCCGVRPTEFYQNVSMSVATKRLDGIHA